MTIWYIARGAGLAALLLLTASTAIGALVSGRRGDVANRVVVQYLHRVTASLGIAVLVLHVGSILLDSYAHVGILGAALPFTSAYRPTWVGLGTIAVYLFILVAAVGFARGRMARSARGAALWRRLHLLAYAGFGLAVLHGFNSGTDTSVGWVRLLYLGCVVAVVGATLTRVAIEVRPARLAVAR